MAAKPKPPTFGSEAEHRARQDAIAIKAFDRAKNMTREQRELAFQRLFPDVNAEERKRRDIN